MPVRKPRGRDLSQEQKQPGKEISSFRVKVEHAIGRVKIFCILKSDIVATNFFLFRVHGLS
ncbi:hypothetical protein EZS27_013988 [termite gut metagenome]|uniref:DDE Tnp4 domain-containing protein n=1 Tax=termite gut metagenome TaxID=433724 RepID=A0A5J4RV99_9ZZZZ